MNKVAVILALIASVFFTSQLSSAKPDKMLHEQCIYPTFLILNSNMRSYGTGVVVKSEKTDYGYLNIGLTCAHVVRNKMNDFFIQIPTEYSDYSTIQKGVNVSCKILELNHRIDYAIISFVTKEKIASAKITFDKVYLGNEVYGVGCSLMQQPRLDYGRITSLNFLNNGYRTSIFTMPGDSGGPVYCKYELIGIKRSISRARFNNNEALIYHISFVAPILNFKEWSEDLKDIFKFVYDEEEKCPIIYKFQGRFDIVKNEHKALGWWER